MILPSKAGYHCIDRVGYGQQNSRKSSFSIPASCLFLRKCRLGVSAFGTSRTSRINFPAYRSHPINSIFSRRISAEESHLKRVLVSYSVPSSSFNLLVFHVPFYPGFAYGQSSQFDFVS